MAVHRLPRPPQTIMKTSSSKTTSQKLAGTVQMARLRVETAETRWKAAKQQAQLARRRRKEVKLIARRAKKQAKQAKADLADARKALAEVEAVLAKTAARRMTRKSVKAKAKARVKPTVRAPRRKAAPPRKRRSQPGSPSLASGPATRVTPVPPQERESSPRLAQAEFVNGEPNGGAREPDAIAEAAATAPRTIS